MTGKSRKSPIIRIVLVLLIVAAAGYAGYRTLQIREAVRNSEEVLEVMYELIPDLGRETEVSAGAGKDPMLTLSINDTDIVGCLEIPSLDLIVPVTVRGEGRSGFASLENGSPVKGKLVIEGDRKTAFMDLSKARPGDKVIFTDVEGIRYSYEVITQYNLKDWDEADNDLMVCCRVDDRTRFVLGCALSE